MTLVVENGTGLSTAESYISAADADTYHTARGNTAWTGTQAIKEAALRRATDYMLQAYRTGWAGFRVNTTQALDWPRYGVPKPDAAGGGEFYALYPSDAVPQEVKRACAELALRALSDSLAPDLDAPVVEETIGPLTTRYADGVRQTKRFQAVDNLLAPLLESTGNALKVERA